MEAQLKLNMRESKIIETMERIDVPYIVNTYPAGDTTGANVFVEEKYVEIVGTNREFGFSVYKINGTLIRYTWGTAVSFGKVEFYPC